MTARELDELDEIAADLEEESKKQPPQTHGAAAQAVLWSIATVLRKIAQRNREWV